MRARPGATARTSRGPADGLIQGWPGASEPEGALAWALSCPFSWPPLPSFQQHPRFFQTLFALGQSPRALQHLARCAVRSCLEGRLLQALPRLHLPPALHQFVLLRFEDVLY